MEKFFDIAEKNIHYGQWWACIKLTQEVISILFDIVFLIALIFAAYCFCIWLRDQVSDE